jgi:hypothetical protein
MEKLVKEWCELAEKYHQEANEKKDNQLLSAKCMAKFFVYRDCAKQLQQELNIPDVMPLVCSHKNTTWNGDIDLHVCDDCNEIMY